MNHRRGHFPKHYKGVLSYKEVPIHRLSQSVHRLSQSVNRLTVGIKSSNTVFKTNRNRINTSNRNCLRICNKEIIKTNLYNKSHRKDRKFSNTVFKAIKTTIVKSLRIIATKTNRNSIRIKIKNRITKSLKITNNKIQRISAINCNKISSHTQTLIVGIKSNNSVIKANRKLNNNDNRKCFRINNRRLIKTNLYNKSCKMN